MHRHEHFSTVLTLPPSSLDMAHDPAIEILRSPVRKNIGENKAFLFKKKKTLGKIKHFCLKKKTLGKMLCFET